MKALQASCAHCQPGSPAHRAPLLWEQTGHNRTAAWLCVRGAVCSPFCSCSQVERRVRACCVSVFMALRGGSRNLVPLK